MSDLVDLLEAECRSLCALTADLSDDEWERSTRLPGWSVKDNLSHLVDGTYIILEQPRPDHHLPEGLPHVRHPFGAYMELGVDVRRGRPGAEVLDEFQLAGERSVQRLRDLGADALDGEIAGPMGSTMTRRAFLDIALVDWWMHEQDIREAVDRPGHLEGDVVAHTVQRLMAYSMAAAARSIGEANGMIVDLKVIGTERREALYRFVDGKAEPTELDAMVSLVMDLPALAALAGGRAPADDLQVSIDGDEPLAQKILANMTFTP